MRFVIQRVMHSKVYHLRLFCQEECAKTDELWRKFVTVHSVHSNLAKIHSRLPAAMEFWLVCLGILAYPCQNTSQNSGV